MTDLFKATSYKSLVLSFSVLLKNILSYADKLLLFPLLGPTAVSVYYTATILGKIVSRVVGPVNSVMLSYLARIEKINFRNFIYIIIFAVVVGTIGYFVIILISPTLLYLLYPKWAAESLELIYITTASAILAVMSSVLNPFILRFSNINYQLLISGTNVLVYIMSALLFFDLYGLIGFCFGILLANFFKLILMICIFSFNYKKVNVKQYD